MNDRSSDVVKLRCPMCNRFLAEVKGYGKAVCRDCGSEVVYRSKLERSSSAANLRIVSAS